MADKTNNPRLGPGFWLPVSWICLVMFLAITAHLWPIHEPDSMDWHHLAATPGTISLGTGGQAADKTEYVYWLGTDTMGRDIISRLVYGARISLSVGLFAPSIGFLIGGMLGCLAGYYRGRLDAVIVAAMDIVLAFPGLVLLLAVTFYLGPSLKNLIVTLGVLSIPAFSRVSRATTLSLVDQEFIEAARLTGAGDFSILMREILPNVIIPLSIYALMVVAFMIMAEGALSFLGLGVPAPVPSWGGMIAEGKEVLDEAPHVSMIPAGVMFLTVFSFNHAGDSIRSVMERRKSQL